MAYRKQTCVFSPISQRRIVIVSSTPRAWLQANAMNIIGVFLLIAVGGFYLYFGAILSVIPWLLCWWGICGVARCFDRAFKDYPSMLRVVSVMYLVISFMGLVMVLDNRTNFGMDFGNAGDDSRYFERAFDMVMQGEFSNLGFYEIVTAAFGAFLNLFYPRPFELLDVLPLNWAFGALVVGLCYQLTFAITGLRCPLFLLTIALVLNYRFTDSIVHLYREGLILCFLLIGMLLVHRDKLVLSLVLLVPLLLLRGANAMFLLYYFFLQAFWRRSRSLMTYYPVVLIGSLLVLLLTPGFGSWLLHHSSKNYNAVEHQYMDGKSIVEIIEFRQQMFADRGVKTSTLTASLSSLSLKAIVIRPIIYMFFPVRFWSPVFSKQINSVYATRYYVENGFFWFHILGWAMVICWIVIIPLIGVGLWKVLRGSTAQPALLIYYLTTVMLVSYVSLQMRHSLSFLIMHPCLASIGYHAFVRDQKTRQITFALAILIAAVLVGYNMMSKSLI